MKNVLNAVYPRMFSQVAFEPFTEKGKTITPHIAFCFLPNVIFMINVNSFFFSRGHDKGGNVYNQI